jgi:hypothetical protein
MHQTAEAEVAVTRQGAEIVVEIVAHLAHHSANVLDMDTPLLKGQNP